MANRFVLRHRGLEIEYDIGRNQALPALTYTREGQATEDFRAIDVTTTDTPLGPLVTVALQKSTDIGGESFGFFLPQADVPLGGCVEVTTAGVYARYSGPDSFPRRPESWHAIELHGTAETVEQPL
jgi:hypothetical protein